MTPKIPTGAVGANGDADSAGAMPERIAQDVADAVYDTAHRYPGGVPTLAVRMGMSANTLNHKVSVTNESHHLTLRESIKMQHVSKDYSILYAYAAALEHVALPTGEDVDGDVGERLARIGVEVGDVFRETVTAMCDGRITAAERKRIRKEVGEAMNSLTSLLQAL